MNRRPSIFATLLIFSAPAIASAQSYNASSGTRTFSSIASTGTALGLSSQDDASQAFSAPFSFPFFGTTISSGTQLYASTNGTLAVGANFTGYSGASFPSGAGVGLMAPFWVDLRFGSTGDIYYRSTGSELVVEWSNVNSYAVSTESISFQIRIASDGTIRYVYGPNTANSGWSSTAIGMEDVGGLYGAQATCTPSCLPADVPSGTEWVFTPGAPAMDGDLTITTANPPTSFMPGQTIRVDYEVANIGPAPTAETTVGLFLGTQSQVTTADLEIANQLLPPLASTGVDIDAVSFTVPAGLPPGTVYAALIVDPGNSVTESNENNNVYALGAFTVGGGGSDIVITTSEIPPATLGIPYDVTLQQMGANPPTWFLLEGSLPSGVNLSQGGRLSGTPAESGTFSFTVECNGPDQNPGIATLSLIVNDGGSGGLTVTPAALPEARVGVPFEVTLTAAGGIAPYAFQVISGRPDWLTVSSDGQMSGTPDASGEHTMTVSVFDSEFNDGTVVFQLRVIESGPLAVVGQIPGGVTGRLYEQRVVQGGTPPYTVTLVDGVLPGDMQIYPDGMLRGTPDAAVNTQLTLQVSDSDGGSVTGQVGLQITELLPLEIPMSEVTVTIRNDVQVALEARGGVPPYQWAIVQGALQEGLALDPAGFLVGRVEEISTATVTFVLSDSEGSRAERSVQILTRAFRPDTSGGGGGRSGRGGGCVCVEPLQTGVSTASSPAAWAGVLLGLTLIGRRRRRSRLSDGSDSGPPGVTDPRGR